MQYYLFWEILHLREKYEFHKGAQKLGPWKVAKSIEKSSLNPFFKISLLKEVESIMVGNVSLFGGFCLKNYIYHL